MNFFLSDGFLIGASCLISGMLTGYIWAKLEARRDYRMAMRSRSPRYIHIPFRGYETLTCDRRDHVA